MPHCQRGRDPKGVHVLRTPAKTTSLQKTSKTSTKTTTCLRNSCCRGVSLFSRVEVVCIGFLIHVVLLLSCLYVFVFISSGIDDSRELYRNLRFQSTKTQRPILATHLTWLRGPFSRPSIPPMSIPPEKPYLNSHPSNSRSTGHTIPDGHTHQPILTNASSRTSPRHLLQMSIRKELIKRKGTFGAWGVPK